jgi:parallel beta-helix repeat protein
MGAVWVSLVGRTAFPATYYVDSETGDDRWDGSARQAQNSAQGPWQHLPGTTGPMGTGWKVLADGDRVIVKGGTLNPVSVGIGSDFFRGQPKFGSIVILGGQLAEPKWGEGRPIFDGQGRRTFGFWVGAGGKAVTGVTLDGLEVRNIQAGGVGDGFDPRNGSSCMVLGGNGGCSFITVRRCHLHDAARDAEDRGHGIETGHADHLLVELNTIGPGIGTKGIELDRSDFCTARGNYVYNTGDHGIVVVGNNCDINDNVVEMLPPFVHDPVYALKVYGNRNDVWNNILFQREQPVPTPLTARAQGFGFFTGAGNRLYHNTIYHFANSPNGREFGTGIAVGCERKAVQDVEVQNNLVYGCRNANGTVQLFLGPAATRVTVRYNAFGHDQSDQVVDLGQGKVLYRVDQLATLPLPNGIAMERNTGAVPHWRAGAFPERQAPEAPGTGAAWGLGYFALTAQTPSEIRATGNQLTGRADQGCNPDPEKYRRDILGVARKAWSMGALEAGGD